jgi:hypothetical protein
METRKMSVIEAVKQAISRRGLTGWEIQREVQRLTGKLISESGATARCRDLRKAQYGGHEVPVSYIYSKTGRRRIEYRLDRELAIPAVVNGTTDALAPATSNITGLRTCPGGGKGCKGEFKPARTTQLYCSERCRVAYWLARHPRMEAMHGN